MTIPETAEIEVGRAYIMTSNWQLAPTYLVITSEEVKKMFEQYDGVKWFGPIEIAG